uniref:Uncharacterized protein n=1 Tax=Lepeophtheirus salmonis TaxID=72036 RepID=A0A0K2TA96_LEPSM
MDDLGAGDCTTDGTCEEDAAGDGNSGIEGLKPSDASLLDETTMAIQQFSVADMKCCDDSAFKQSIDI